MAITLKDIAAGNKRMADQPFTSYREGTAKAITPASTSLDDLKSMSEALKKQQAPDLSEREIESNRILSQIQADISYMPKLYKEVVDMNKSLKKTMMNIVDGLESVANNGGGGGFFSKLLGGAAIGGGAAAGAKMLRGAKGAKYSPKGRIIPKLGTFAGELTKDVMTAGKELKGIGGKAIDAGVKVTKSAAATGASKWKPFMTWLEKRSPKLFAKVAPRILAAGAGLAIPGPGWVWTAVSVIGSITLAYEVYQMWQEYSKTEATTEDKPAKAEEDSKKPKVLDAKDAPKDDKVTKSSISGKVLRDKADGPITLNGQTLNPGDPGYDEAEKELVNEVKKMRDTKDDIERNADDRIMKRGKYKKAPSKFTQAMDAVKGFFGVKPKKEEDIGVGDDEAGLTQEEANKYAGAFAKGGKIPAGKKGVVGEAGPELVEGPANITNAEDFANKLKEGDAKVRKQLEDLQLELYTVQKLASGEGIDGNHFNDLSKADQKKATQIYNQHPQKIDQITKMLNSDSYKDMMSPEGLKMYSQQFSAAKSAGDQLKAGVNIDKIQYITAKKITR